MAITLARTHVRHGKLKCSMWQKHPAFTKQTAWFHTHTHAHTDREEAFMVCPIKMKSTFMYTKFLQKCMQKHVIGTDPERPKRAASRDLDGVSVITEAARASDKPAEIKLHEQEDAQTRRYFSLTSFV